MKKRVGIVFAVVIAISLFFLAKYIIYNMKYVSSNAAFVKSDNLTNLSFKLAGKIDKIYVKEGEKVKKNTLLAKLDTKNLEIQKAILKYQIKSLENKKEALILQKDKLSTELKKNLLLNSNQISKLNSLIKAKEFEIKSKEIELDKLKSDYLKFKKLYNNHKISKEKFEKVKTAYFSAKEKINALKEFLYSMKKDKKALYIKTDIIKNGKKDINRLQKEILALDSNIASLKDKLRLINLHIKDSYLYAPFDGILAKKFVNSNEIINAGKFVVSLVNLKNLYVLDLLEETKLKGIKKGCLVNIYVDATDKNYKGVVSEILPASAATFAILPRDISSGEFTKLAQRFYVKIKFKKLPKDLLVGMSAEVEIEKCK
jgi:membrane fusion protein (multidrug efflux system)